MSTQIEDIVFVGMCVRPHACAKCILPKGNKLLENKRMTEL